MGFKHLPVKTHVPASKKYQTSLKPMYLPSKSSSDWTHIGAFAGRYMGFIVSSYINLVFYMGFKRLTVKTHAPASNMIDPRTR
jgi:hypothetical protein